MISNQVSSLIHDAIAYLDAKIDPRNKRSSYFDPTAIRACVIIGRTLHTEARFVPDSPLPKLLFWLQFAPLRQFLKTYKSVSVHVSL